jgi:hypothetical protein
MLPEGYVPVGWPTLEPFCAPDVVHQNVDAAVGIAQLVSQPPGPSRRANDDRDATTQRVRDLDASSSRLLSYNLSNVARRIRPRH